MLQKIRWFLLITGVLVAVIIALQNQQPTPLTLLFTEVDMPLAMLLLATSAASFVLGALTTALMLKKSSAAKAQRLDAKNKKPEVRAMESMAKHPDPSASKLKPETPAS